MLDQDILESRIQAALNAVSHRVWLNGSYEAQTREGEPDGPIARSVLPYRVYRSKDGNVVVDGYDTYRGTVRTFRLDRFLDFKLGDQLETETDPSVLYTRKGEVVVYPMAAKLWRCTPQTVPAHQVDNFIRNGWGLTPPDFVVDANVH